MPEDWDVFLLRELESRGVIALSRGNVISKTDIRREPGEYPIYSSSVHNEGLFGRYGRYMFDEELITWSIDGGGHFFHRSHHRFSVTNVCGYMRVDATQIDCRFLAAQLQNLHLAKSFDYQIKAHPSVIRGEYTIPLPPLPEQRAIASALSDVDALLEGLTRLIAKKRDLKQAAMQQLLTGQTRLPGFAGEWEVKPLRDVLSIRHGKNQREVQAVDGSFPILASGGRIGWSLRPIYEKPSVLIGRKGTINRPQYMDTPFWTVDTLFYSEMIGENNARFVYYLFTTVDWMQFNEGSGVPSLNAKTIEAVERPLPSVEEQKAIADVLSDMDTELSALEARREKTVALKQAMMQELLTGRTRLV
ncbi:restriction endonuclease subunit S [Gemmatimonas sp.]|uniref:restriction endonuclease subunit S n=1 Tax=Gemmatimonas sp. TaxID=1962908 RepID=UPI003F71EAFA